MIRTENSTPEGLSAPSAIPADQPNFRLLVVGSDNVHVRSVWPLVGGCPKTAFCLVNPPEIGFPTVPDPKIVPGTGIRPSAPRHVVKGRLASEVPASDAAPGDVNKTNCPGMGTPDTDTVRAAAENVPSPEKPEAALPVPRTSGTDVVMLLAGISDRLRKKPNRSSDHSPAQGW